jgi:hypothetical protein
MELKLLFPFNQELFNESLIVSIVELKPWISHNYHLSLNRLIAFIMELKRN